MAEPIRIANCSGFYGDRLSAAKEMVEGGPIDALTGDWLAELTMLILAKNIARDPATGYAKTFVTQMEQVMGTCLDKGIKVVANAGGLRPKACAEAVQKVADKLGLKPKIAWVEGDDLMPRLGELTKAGVDFRNFDSGASLGERKMMTANAYFGGFGIAEALGRDADIVITGRVTDAAVVVGPAAWHHGWKRDEWDALAGAVVAGHVIECGTQTTGGNYAFFQELTNFDLPGFPIAEVAADGSSVITKHPGHGGMVSIGTVTAQVLYEIGAVGYKNPDVTSRFDTIQLTQEAPDRVRIHGVRGESPPETLKVAMNYEGGHRTTTTLYLTGIDIEEKAAHFEKAFWGSFPKGRETFAEVDVQLVRSDHENPATNEEAIASLRITVKDPDPKKVGRPIFAAMTELGLANYPGFTGGGTQNSTYGVYWPATVPAKLVPQEVVIGDERIRVESSVPAGTGAPVEPPRIEVPVPGGETRRAPLGRIMGARSGDKGGNANLGVWTRSDASYAWLSSFLTLEKLRDIMVEARDHEVQRYDLPNIRALNFVFVGILGLGVAASSRMDPQAKGLGEYMRAKVVDIPVGLLEEKI